MVISLLIAPDNQMCRKPSKAPHNGLTKDGNQHISSGHHHNVVLLNKPRAKSWLCIREDKPIHKESVKARDFKRENLIPGLRLNDRI